MAGLKKSINYQHTFLSYSALVWCPCARLWLKSFLVTLVVSTGQTHNFGNLRPAIPWSPMYRLLIPYIKPSVRESMIKSRWAPGLIAIMSASDSHSDDYLNKSHFVCYQSESQVIDTMCELSYRNLSQQVWRTLQYVIWAQHTFIQ